MDVRCPKCQTLYELDDTQVKSPIITLKCSQCQYVFRHESRHAAVQENHRRWMVRKRKTGDILYCNAFDVLHQWIMSGQISKRDSISRTGTKWMELGEIGEFQPVFQVVESISTLTGQPLPEDSTIAVRKISDSHAAQAPEPAPAPPPARMPTPAQGVPSGAPGPRNRERIRTELQFAPMNPPEEVTQRARPSRMTPGALPAPLPPNPRQLREERQPTPAPTSLGGTVETEWHIGDDVPHTHLTSEVTSQTALPPRSKIPWVIAGLLVCAGLGYVGMTQGMFDGLMAPQQPTEVVALGNATGTQVAETNNAPQTATQTAPPKTADQQVSPAVTEAIATSSPKVHHALGVAVQAGEVAAQSSSPDEKVEEARRVLERGRASQALGMFKEVLDVAPKHAGAVAGLGWCYIEMGRFDDAASNFRRAIDLDQRQGDALIGLGTAERQRGNLKAAYDAYDLYLGRFPKGSKSSIARYQLDALRQQLGL